MTKRYLDSTGLAYFWSKIKSVFVKKEDVGNTKSFYGTCATAAATVVKEVTCPDFISTDLVDGVTVLVKFSITNTGSVASLKLNVNQTGEYPIKKIYNSSISNLTAVDELRADAVIQFVFTGTYWMVTGYDYNTTYEAGNGIDISSSNYISVKIDGTNANGLGVGSSGLSLGVVTPSVSGVGGANGAMTAADKEKLDGISAGAGVQVQSDWNQSDTTAPDYIKNKILPSSTAPAMDGTASAGTSTDYARKDHVHPSDTSKQDKLIAGTDLEIVSRVPSNCVEIEYLESDGQYINTHIKPIANEVSSVDFKLVTTGTGIFFGSRYAASSKKFTIGKGSVGLFAALGTHLNQSLAATDTLRHTITIDTGTGQANIDGGSDVFVGSFVENNLNIIVFGVNENGIITANANVRIYEVYIGSRMHLIPVRVGTVGYMYDTVGGQLYGNDGTGDFILGPDMHSLEVINFTNETGYITSNDVPQNTSDLINDGSDGTSTYVEASDLANVATSGSYNDLVDIPTIPTVNNATLTIKQGGTTKGTFTANASTDIEINLDAGGGGGSAGTLDTTATTAQTPASGESLDGSVTLHKVSKTGTYSDLIDKPTYAQGITEGGIAVQSAKILYGVVDGTSTSTAFTATINGVTALADGVCIYLTNNVVSSEAGYTININNLGAKPVYLSNAASSQSETNFAQDTTFLFVYNSTRVSGGCWDLYYAVTYTSVNTAYQIRTNHAKMPVVTACYRYRLLFTSPDGAHYVPANASTSTSATSSKTVTTEKIDPFGDIVCYNNTPALSAGSSPNATYLYRQVRFTLGYSFNRTGAALTLTAQKPVYIKCSPQSDGSVKIDGTTPYVQDLPTTEDGYVYIFLGIATAATYVELFQKHPVYYYKNGCVRQWTNDDVVHKSGTETIVGEKTFSDALKLGTSLTFDTGQNEGVYIEAGVDNDGTKLLTFADTEDDSPVRMENIALPVIGNDAATKEYVDGAVAVTLNGQSGTYGIFQKSLCAFMNKTNGFVMTSLTTSGGTSQKNPNSLATFPVGCKIYFYEESSDFASNTNFTSKKFNTTYKIVDARYSAITGSNVSLGSGDGSAVYLMVAVADGLWSPYFKSGQTNEIIVSSSQLTIGRFYIYLGRTVGSTGYEFQLEDNNPLYYYDGSTLIDWSTHIAEQSASVYSSGAGIDISQSFIVSHKGWSFNYGLQYDLSLNPYQVIGFTAPSNKLPPTGTYLLSCQALIKNTNTNAQQVHLVLRYKLESNGNYTVVAGTSATLPAAIPSTEGGTYGASHVSLQGVITLSSQVSYLYAELYAEAEVSGTAPSLVSAAPLSGNMIESMDGGSTNITMYRIGN